MYSGRAFPVDYGAVSLGIASVQYVCGVAKSKGVGRGILFWLCTGIQLVTATALGMFLILASARRGYSGLERAAAYVTVSVAILGILYELAVVHDLLWRKDVMLDGRIRSTLLAIILTCVLISFSLPVLMAAFSSSGTSSSLSRTSPFVERRHAVLLLLFAVSPLMVLLCLILILLLVELMPGSLTHSHYHTLSYHAVVNAASVISATAVCGTLILVLGLGIRAEGDNISLTLLVICNVLPVVITMVSSTSLDECNDSVIDITSLENMSLSSLERDVQNPNPGQDPESTTHQEVVITESESDLPQSQDQSVAHSTIPQTLHSL